MIEIEFIPAGSLVTTEGGSPVARLTKPLDPQARNPFDEDLFCDWQIEPLRNGMTGGGFLGSDGRLWAMKTPLPTIKTSDTVETSYIGIIHIDGYGWWPARYRQ